MVQRKVVCVLAFLLTGQLLHGQSLQAMLNVALKKLSADKQFAHAQLSLCVVNSSTGNIVFEQNAQLGLAPASCQKIVTSVSAYEMLGKDFRFKTYIGIDNKVTNGVLDGNLYIIGGGDPTTGSQRWAGTSETVVLQRFLKILKEHMIKSIKGNLICNDLGFTTNPLPGGWIWEDIGNYYGAGAWGFNWRENQYDVTFTTGQTKGAPTKISSTRPAGVATAYQFTNEVTTGAAGSGDNAYLFTAPYHPNIIARGTVPVSSNGFTISGALPDPPAFFINTLQQYLPENSIALSGKVGTTSGNRQYFMLPGSAPLLIDSLLSPSLDSVNYWFLKKSVNLFGEALVKAIAVAAGNKGETANGTDFIRAFWKKAGIPAAALKIVDGSGLSPANRITTHALTSVLQYARKQSWFNGFYNALPEINGIKMKDGYISGVRSYTGYVTNRSGEKLTFAFIVNNFDGSPAEARIKMWKVLDLLK